MRAIVVDDSRAMRAVLRRWLIQAGFDVIEAEDGAAGMRQLRGSLDVGLVLVDMHMPGMNGMEFLRQVRQEAAYADVRLMMVSTETNFAEIRDALGAGADEYLMKPFNREGLMDKLKLLGFGA